MTTMVSMHAFTDDLHVSGALTTSFNFLLGPLIFFWVIFVYVYNFSNKIEVIR